jgi:hypothetical protein
VLGAPGVVCSSASEAGVHAVRHASARGAASRYGGIKRRRFSLSWHPRQLSFWCRMMRIAAAVGVSLPRHFR